VQIDEIIDLVNPIALHEMSVADDPFYNGRFRSNAAYSWYNLRLLGEIQRMALPVAGYHEIGGGAGLLAIGLALLGYDAVNIDHYEPRLACGRRILERLGESAPALASRVTMVLGRFPEATVGLATKDSLAITTNFAGTHAGEPAMRDWELVAFLDAVHSRYGGYLFDACLLGGHHRQPEAWKHVLDLVSDVFGNTPTLVFEMRADYSRYYLVES
jgi:hypothetical protein